MIAPLTRDKNSRNISTHCHRALEWTTVNDCLVDICHRFYFHKAWFDHQCELNEVLSHDLKCTKEKQGADLWSLLSHSIALSTSWTPDLKWLMIYLCSWHCPVLMFLFFPVSFTFFDHPWTKNHNFKLVGWCAVWVDKVAHSIGVCVCIFAYMMCFLNNKWMGFLLWPK